MMVSTGVIDDKRLNKLQRGCVETLHRTNRPKILSIHGQKAT